MDKKLKQYGNKMNHSSCSVTTRFLLRIYKLLTYRLPVRDNTD